VLGPGANLWAMRCALIGLAFIGCVLLTLTACGRQVPPPEAFHVLREYGFNATVADPEPTWNPSNYQILVRAAGGFAILDEGGGRQEYFAGKEKREYHHAAWLDAHRFIVGPNSNIITTEEGRIVPNTDGLRILSVLPGRPVDVREFALVGYWPRPWNDGIIAQVEDKISIYDANGKRREFGVGFNPIPQRKGVGVAYQETPIFEKDYWTAKTPLGALVIRWRPGVITTIPAATEACWTAQGGVVATKLTTLPKPGEDWPMAASTLVYSAGPDVAIKEIGTGLAHPDCHPAWPLVVANDVEGQVVLISLTTGERRIIAKQGDYPRWSGDGRRLLVQETSLTGVDAGQIYLHVYVLGIQNK
jgi:hypothetical protein